MNGTALSTTTAGSMSLATLAPFIDWALNGFPHPVPQTTSLAIAALVIPVVHLAYLWLSRKTGVLLETPAAPVAPATPAA